MRKPHRRLSERNFDKRSILLVAGIFLLLPLLFSVLASTRPHGGADIRTPPPPRLAYMISGSSGDLPRVKRLLMAIYHPWNCYLVRLDLESERRDFAEFLRKEKVIKDFDNVRLVEGAGPVSSKGPSEVASMLQGIAILLREFKDWNWFINLSASDYPLLSQDDILHSFSYIPRDYNFIEHTSNIGWREARPMIVDSGLYASNRSQLHWMKEKRSMPASFKLFVGSSWVVLNRSFLEFCIRGWDNLPRMLLMYFVNFLYSSEAYFHTVICNSKYFQNTTVNGDLRFTLWDNPPKLLPMNLSSRHFDLMADSGAPFAHSFGEDGYQVLDRIDRELLRKRDRFAPGGWCMGSTLFGRDPCSAYSNSFIIRPTDRSKKLEKLLIGLLDPDSFRSRQCK
ncbi:xylosyltransferase 1-like protein [Carex littledalei]|uniref:Xylosyltransferase 1-like protein n=1 Tax=Carex littledalei TaxID=544730 RepID=A0A833R8B9_9POAL|nr:xylosyltransferase 1-like protein [Carex littledalei]